MLDDDDPLLVVPGVETRPIRDGLLLVNLDSGGCFRLNRVGTEVWRMLEQHPLTTPRRLSQRIAERYAVSSDQLKRDLAELLADLVREHLIRVAAEAPRVPG